MTTVSVLICTYRRPDALLPCLAGLVAQTRLPDDVILVVRPSDVATHEAMAARAPDGLPWRIVPVHEPGLVAARNAGLAALRSDVVAFCDDDTVASPEWLARVLVHFEDGSVGGVGGRDRCHDGTGFDDRQRAVVGHLQWWGRAIGNHHLGFGAAREVDFLKGANMSFRAEAVRGRWFDTRLRGKGAQANDDFSFSLSVARGGWTLIYDPAAMVDHYAASDQLRSYVVQPGLPDPLSYHETCFNYALTVWDQMGTARRAVFVAWSTFIGVGNYPGLLQAVRFWLRRDPAAWRKFRINQAAHREVFRAGSVRRPALSSPMVERPKALMRFGIVTRRIGPNDGQGRVNMEVAREALRQGFRVTLFCESADPALVDSGADLVALPPPTFLPSRLLRDQVFAARSAVALRGCDAVLANGFATWARSDVNAVHFVHRAWAASPHHPWRQHRDARSFYARLYAGLNARLERNAFRRAPKVVAVSLKLKAELIEGGVPEAHIETILNGVDTEEFAPGPGDRAALGLQEQCRIALFAGDLRTSRKNLDSVLRALPTSSPTLHLAVAGRHENTPWPALAAALGVADRVHFLGFRTDMPALMRAADFFVFPSRYEACSLVLLEALASGLPVITAASAGGAEIVTPDVGFVLPDSEDVAGLSGLMTRLAEDEGLLQNMKQAARKNALAHGWQAMARRYVALLESARHA